MTSAIKETRDLDADLELCEAATASSLQNEVFLNVYLNTAREGWSYAIKRAMEAENEVDRLHNELNILQERQRGRGCWD